MNIQNIDYRGRVSFITVSFFFLCSPLVDISGQISYLPFEIISLLYIKDFILQKNYNDVFIKWYFLVILWGIVVSILSLDPHISFISLRYWIIPIFVYMSLLNLNIRKIFSAYIWIPTILFLLENIVLFIYWSKFSYLFTDYPILNRVMLSFGDWYAKIYTSTIVLCMLVGVHFFIQKSLNRYLLIVINLISAFLSYDRAFWFALLLILVAYVVFEKIRLSIKNLLIGLVAMVLLIILLMVMMKYIGMDLHYKERFATYDYWLSIVHVSPIYGFGVGRDSLRHYTELYPVPAQIMSVNPFTPYTSHNFFVDLLLTQGVVGLLIFITLLIKVNFSAVKNSINQRYKYVSLYMTIAIFSKFLVDNQFDNRKIFIFWFFILIGYLASIKNTELKR